MSHPPDTIRITKGKQVAHRINLRLAQSRDSIKTLAFILSAIRYGRIRQGFGRIPLLINLIKQGR